MKIKLHTKLRTKFSHFGVEWSLHKSRALHVRSNLWQFLESCHELLKVRIFLETIWDKELVLVNQLIHDEINKRERLSGKPRFLAKKCWVLTKLGVEIGQVTILEVFKVRVVTQSNPSIAEVHGLFCHHVNHCPLCVILSKHIILPCNVS